MPTGKKFKSKFIQAGLANYPNSFGIALIRKESFDKFIKTLEGKPVIINHQDVTKDNFKDVEVGTVCNVWYDPSDGWYWCDGVITDETAIELIKNKGWSVSCSYNITLANDEGGLENNVHYDIEFLDGVFTHLAIVNNPRYERANIVLNSKTEFLNEGITIDNGGAGSGDFDHAGRPGEVGGSEPAGTGRKGKYEGGKRNWVGAKPSGTMKNPLGVSKDDMPPSLKIKETEANIIKDIPDIKNIETEQPKETNKQDGEFLIKKETSKAVYLEKDGISFWTPKRYFKNGKLTPAGERIYGEKKEMKEALANLEKTGIEFEHSWESEKAYGVDTWAEDYNTGKLKKVRVFIPKSQIMENGNIPLWLFQKKIQEINEKIGVSGMKGDYGSGFKTDFYKGNILFNSVEDKIYTVLDDTLYEFDDFKDLNTKEQDMALLDELKKLVANIDNAKDEIIEDDCKVDNEHVDKRKLIDEVGGILKDKVDDEIIRTVIGKMEKLAYDESEKKDEKKVDNEVIVEEPEKEEKKEEDDKKVEELKDDVKEDVENKCKNSVENSVEDNKVDNAKEDYFTRLYQVYNASMEIPQAKEHITQSDRLEYGKKF